MELEQDVKDTLWLSTSLQLKVSGALLCFYIKYFPGAGLQGYFLAVDQLTAEGVRYDADVSIKGSRIPWTH